MRGGISVFTYQKLRRKEAYEKEEQFQNYKKKTGNKNHLPV